MTSDQCLGCHDAGSTGLQFEMTAPDPSGGGQVLNLSPYGTWVSSPMGLGGRDPVFFAMLASETETFHPEVSELVQDICLGCHGVTGQRQFKIDAAKIDAVKAGGRGGRGQGRLIVDRTHGGAVSGAAAAAGGAAAATYGGADDECRDQPYLREVVDAVPFPHGNPLEPLARYGALSRDGISCTSCHRMLVGVGDGPALDRPENRCVEQRQELLNPGLTGFARTFTGSFLVGPPDRLIGPFAEPKRSARSSPATRWSGSTSSCSRWRSSSRTSSASARRTRCSPPSASTRWSPASRRCSTRRRTRRRR